MCASPCPTIELSTENDQSRNQRRVTVVVLCATATTIVTFFAAQMAPVFQPRAVALGDGQSLAAAVGIVLMLSVLAAALRRLHQQRGVWTLTPVSIVQRSVVGVVDELRWCDIERVIRRRGCLEFVGKDTRICVPMCLFPQRARDVDEFAAMHLRERLGVAPPTGPMKHPLLVIIGLLLVLCIVCLTARVLGGPVFQLVVTVVVLMLIVALPIIGRRERKRGHH
jgi:hypothetical protein